MSYNYMQNQPPQSNRFAYNNQPQLSIQRSQNFQNNPPSNPSYSQNSAGGQNPLNFQFAENSRSTSYQGLSRPRENRQFYPQNPSLSINSTGSRNPLQVNFGDSTSSRGALPNFPPGQQPNSLSMSYGRQGSLSVDKSLPRGAGQNNYSNSSSYGGGLQRSFNPNRQHGFGNSRRDEIDYIKTKNKALTKCNIDALPGFISRLNELKGTVKKNINFSFTSRLKDIWTSYIQDQKRKSKPIDERKLLEDLKPIETATVDSLDAQTDLVVQKIKLSQLEQIQAFIARQCSPEVPTINIHDPLYEVKLDHQRAKEEYDAVKNEYYQCKQEEDEHDFQIRERYRQLLDKHFESYNREYKIKYANDMEMASKKLQEARSFYSLKNKEMQQDLRRGSGLNRITSEQQRVIDDLRAKITQARNS